MHELGPPPGISPADWETTPRSVRMVILALLEQVQTFQTRITNLEAQLHQHSANSSRPPSSDLPSAPPRLPKARSGRKRGAQSGHPGHHRDLLPPDQVTEFVVHMPSACSHCQHDLPAALPISGPVLRQQVWELPPIQPTVTGHQFLTRTCPHCQKAVRTERPAEVPPGSFGPHLTALVALLHGRYRMSVRDLSGMMDEVWHIPLSVGSVPTLYQTVSCALAPVYDEVHQVVQAQTVANVDETPWRENRPRRFLWVVVTVVATVFLVARHSRAALEHLLDTPLVASSVRTAIKRMHTYRPSSVSCAGHT